MTEAAEGASAILGLVALMWVTVAIVFGPRALHRALRAGAVLLYRSIAIVFGWLYRFIAEAVPAEFSGLKFAAGQHGA